VDGRFTPSAPARWCPSLDHERVQTNSVGSRRIPRADEWLDGAPEPTYHSGRESPKRRNPPTFPLVFRGRHQINNDPVLDADRTDVVLISVVTRREHQSPIIGRPSGAVPEARSAGDSALVVPAQVAHDDLCAVVRFGMKRNSVTRVRERCRIVASHGLRELRFEAGRKVDHKDIGSLLPLPGRTGSTLRRLTSRSGPKTTSTARLSADRPSVAPSQ